MYPQLIVLAVHTYFLVGAIARQYITSEEAQNKSTVSIFPSSFSGEVMEFFMQHIAFHFA